MTITFDKTSGIFHSIMYYSRSPIFLMTLHPFDSNGDAWSRFSPDSMTTFTPNHPIWDSAAWTYAIVGEGFDSITRTIPLASRAWHSLEVHVHACEQAPYILHPTTADFHCFCSKFLLLGSHRRLVRALLQSVTTVSGRLAWSRSTYSNWISLGFHLAILNWADGDGQFSRHCSWKSFPW